MTVHDTPIPGRWLATLLILSLAAVALMLVQAHETLAVDRSSAIALMAGATLAAGLRWGLRDARTRAGRIARDLAEYVGLFAAVSLLGAVASYPEAAASSGLADPALERIDRALHFNWIGWYQTVASHPALQMLEVAAYESIFLSPAILVGWYAWAGERAEARRFLAAFWLAAAATLAIFPHMAAIGPLAFLWHGRVPYMPVSALYQAQLLPALRDHGLGVVEIGQLHGLVCAPSFHTSSAVLYLAFGWREPRLRWPLATLNLAMLLATPVEGTHYLADMILGALVAIASVAAVRLASEATGRAAISAARRLSPVRSARTGFQR